MTGEMDRKKGCLKKDRITGETVVTGEMDRKRLLKKETE